MKNPVAFGAVAFLASVSLSTAAPTKDEIIAKENAVWNAFNDRNVEQVKK